MVEPIPDLPANVLGFRARGMVTASDYESVIIPAVEALFSRQRKVRFLYQLGDDFSGFEAAAMWDDARIGMKHLTHWERVAVVTNVDWIRMAVKAFRLVMPGHVRVFHNGEFAQAVAWVSE